MRDRSGASGLLTRRAGDSGCLAADGAAIVNALDERLDVLRAEAFLYPQDGQQLVQAPEVVLVGREVAFCRLRAGGGFLNHVRHPHSFGVAAVLRNIMRRTMPPTRVAHHAPYGVSYDDLQHVLAHA
jgi:hypothetical protein